MVIVGVAFTVRVPAFEFIGVQALPIMQRYKLPFKVTEAEVIARLFEVTPE